MQRRQLSFFLFLVQFLFSYIQRDCKKPGQFILFILIHKLVNFVHGSNPVGLSSQQKYISRVFVCTLGTVPEGGPHLRTDIHTLGSYYFQMVLSRTTHCGSSSHML